MACNLALAAQFDGVAPRDRPAALLRDTLAPMLEAHFRALRPTSKSPPRRHPEAKPPG
jgi:hypothetical protein